MQRTSPIALVAVGLLALWHPWTPVTTEQSARAPSLAQAPICPVQHNGRWRALPCPRSAAPARETDPTLRDLAGLRGCWWTAEQRDFEAIRGIGPTAAGRLVRYRDAGHPLRADNLRTIRGVGPRLATTLLAALTAECGPRAGYGVHPPLGGPSAGRSP